MSAVNTTFLAGERLYLRPLAESDLDGPYLSWLNDEEVCFGNSHHVFPYNRIKGAEYIRQVSSSQHELVLAMVLKAKDRHIGNIALNQINPRNQSAEFTILIGDREAWGKGYGLEAGRLLLRHAFRALNLHRVGCGTFSTNVGMQKLALAMGMKQEGIRRAAVWKDGQFVDVLEYGVLREEFESR